MTDRRRTRTETGLWGLVLVVCGAAGCNTRPPAPPGAVWVDGEVRHGSDPLPFGVVQFFGRNSGASGSVRIRAGRFGLHLQPGPYQVAIIAEETPGHEDEKGGYVPAKSLIPERYGEISTSKLEAEVRPSMGRLRFELER